MRMPVPRMRSFLHAPVVRRSIQALHLSAVARVVAYRAMTRGRDVMTLTCAETTVSFSVPTPEIWRAIDTVAAEPILSSWLEQVRPDDVVFDVGAHYGVYSMFAAARGARVFAFEPDAARHESFLASRGANGF